MTSANPIIVAHRGLHHVHPENSMEAFQAAIDAGCQCAECDVWLSADGEVVVLHDETLDRTTTGTGRVELLDWPALSKLHLRDANGVIQSNHLPRLIDLPIDGINCYVEIKLDDSPQLVCKVIDVMKTAKLPWVLQSFYPSNLFHALRYDPSVLPECLADNMAMVEIAIKERFRAVNLDHQLLKEPVRDALQAAGCRIGVWTVNREKDIRRAVELGVDVLITDEPMLARNISEEMKKGNF